MSEKTEPAATPDDAVAPEVAAQPESAAPVEPAEPEQAQVSIRRAPKYSVFLGLGVILGVIAALVLTTSFPENDDFTPAQVFGFLLLICGVAGLALGGFVAWLFDLASKRSIRAVDAERQALADDDA